MTAPPDRIWAWNEFDMDFRIVERWTESFHDDLPHTTQEYVLLNGPTMQAALDAAEARGREQGLRAGLDHACSVIDAHSEYDQTMCCGGHECGCQGSSVHQVMKHWISSWTDATPPADGGDT